MFYDLNLGWQDANTLTHRERLSMACKLNIDTFALTEEVPDKLNDRTRCSMQPLNLASLQSNLQDALLMQQNLPANLRRQPTISQQTRLTLVTEDSSAAAQAFTGTLAAAASYDLLAIQPLSERVLQQACTSLDVDIITFDLARRLPFRLKSGPLQAAIKRGIFFEILYAPALREETARRNVFTNALALTRATRGKGIIISSGARSAFELRGPYDVINMATLFGLSQQDAKAAVSKNCDAVLAHAKARKAYKGAVILETEGDTGQAGASTSTAGDQQLSSPMHVEKADKQGQSSKDAQLVDSRQKAQLPGVQNAGRGKQRKRKSR